MTKFTALGLLLALFCWTQPSIAAPADADDSTPPASAVPTPENNGTGQAGAGAWRRHHRMQADANGQAPAAGASSNGDSQGQGPGPGGGRRRGQGLGLGGGGGRGHGPGQRIKAVMALQSLTADQRQKIKGIADGLRQDEQNLRGQIKSLQDAGGAPAAGASAAPAKGAAPAAASAGGDSQGQIKQLHQQMRQKGMAAWNQIKGVLSDAQMKELDQAEASNGQLVAPKNSSAPSSGKTKDDSEG